MLKGFGICSAAVIAGSLIPSREGILAADELPHLDEDDSQAKALNYVHDASQASAELRQPGDAFCHNCLHFKGESDETWAGCAIFPGKSVNRDGWCSAWVVAE